MKHFLLLLIIVLTSCVKSEKPDSVEITNFTLEPKSEIEVFVKYKIVIKGNPKIIEKGVICSVDANASILNARLPENSSNEKEQKNYIVIVKSPNTVFYIRPYVITNLDTILGDVKTFQSGQLFQFGSTEDVEGNTYKTTKIGNQEWMASNLKTSHYSNGDLIPVASSISDLIGTTEGKWFNNDFDNQNESVFGKRYTILVYEDNRNVCPVGWRIPNEADLFELKDFLGHDPFFAGKLKTTGTIAEGTGIWDYPNFRATNESGLSILPGGFFQSNSQFTEVGSHGGFCFLSNDGFYKSFITSSNSTNFDVYGLGEINSQFVRCIKE